MSAQYDETLVGEEHAEHFHRQFQRYDNQKGWYVPTWNWSAFGAMGVWALYRKMYKNFYWWAPIFGVCAFAEEASGMEDLFYLTWFLMAIYYGFAGDYYYYRHIRNTAAQAERLNAHERALFLQKNSGTLPWVPWVFGFLGVVAAALAVSIPLYDYFNKSDARGALYDTRGKY